MKKLTLLLSLAISFHAASQSVFGYWYGPANVKGASSANNYLIELILQPEKNHVKGILNYFFKNSYRSMKIEGNYDPTTRQVTLYNIPLIYYGSIAGMDVDCPMTLRATLRVAQAGSNLQGIFFSLPEYKYTCPDITFNFLLNADISKKDSVMNAMAEYRETYQVWQPSEDDTLVAIETTPKKVINYPTEAEFTKRQKVIAQEIEVESDSLRIDVFDNGEIDGDLVSLFFNEQLILYNQKLTHKAIRIDLVIDRNKAINEISMFAENLGLIPPNTAMVRISDGKNRYEIKISSSLEKNATLRLKRKGL